jgi:dienelactone hydrolase
MGDVMGMRVPYQDNEQPLEGYLAASASAHELPGVLVVPSWLNVVESTCRRADRLAGLGYAVFVEDLFGAGIRPRPPQLPQEVVGPFLNDRLQFRRRLLAGLKTFQRRLECDGHRIAAIGYCLGGCGVLELARAGAPLRGAVSVHGMLGTPTPARRKVVQAKILVLHGDADPLSPLDQLTVFRDEMRLAEANWEIDIYGGARHSFTSEGILDQESPEAGIHPQADSRSWRKTVDFLAEVLK